MGLPIATSTKRGSATAADLQDGVDVAHLRDAIHPPERVEKVVVIQLGVVPEQAVERDLLDLVRLLVRVGRWGSTIGFARLMKHCQKWSDAMILAFLRRRRRGWRPEGEHQ